MKLKCAGDIAQLQSNNLTFVNGKKLKLYKSKPYDLNL